MNARRCEYIALGRRVSRLHNCRGIRYPLYRHNGCLVTRFAFTNNLGVHPLFLHIWVQEDGFYSFGQVFDEASTFGCPCCWFRCGLQFFGECFEMCIGAQIWDLAVLWEEFGRSRDSVSARLRYKLQIASIVVRRRPQIPGICSSRCPRARYRRGFVDDGFATRRCEGVSILIVRPI